MPANHIDVVLVHGAWADGSSWSKVIGPLKADGINVIAAPLPLTSLADDVAALDRVLERLDGPVVLPGHAYAGAVIAATRSPKASKLEPDSHGLVWLPGSAFADAFAQNASSEEQAILAAVQRPLAAACISVPVERPLWKDRPSWFLIAEDDRMIPPDTHRFMAGRANAHARTRPVDHTPPVTAPGEVVNIIRDAVRDVATSS